MQLLTHVFANGNLKTGQSRRQRLFFDILIMRRFFVGIAILAAMAAANRGGPEEPDVDYVDECPEENGVFADAVYCDKYYECKDGVVTNHTCDDGLVFDEANTNFAVCSFPFSIDCSGREALQDPQPSENCPRNGDVSESGL